MFRFLVYRTKLIIGNKHFNLVGGLEADSKRLHWNSCKMSESFCGAKVQLKCVTKLSRAFDRFIALKDCLPLTQCEDP